MGDDKRVGLRQLCALDDGRVAVEDFGAPKANVQLARRPFASDRVGEAVGAVRARERVCATIPAEAMTLSFVNWHIAQTKPANEALCHFAFTGRLHTKMFRFAQSSIRREIHARLAA